MSMAHAVAELRRRRLKRNHACAFWRGYNCALDKGAVSRLACPYSGDSASSRGYRRAWLAGHEACLKKDLPECECCGANDYEGDLKNCRFCDRTKCLFCDPGDDVPCGLCEEEATS